MSTHFSQKQSSAQLPSTSIHRLQMLQKQQEDTYKAFQLQNFYKNKKLNINSLKQRIQKFKLSKINSNKNNSRITIKEEIQTKRKQDVFFAANRVSKKQEEFVKKSTVPHERLERIVVPSVRGGNKNQQQNYRNQQQVYNSTKYGDFNNNRNELQSKAMSRKYIKQPLKINEQVRQNHIKSNIQTYEPATIHHNPQYHQYEGYNNGSQNNKIKRQKTQQERQENKRKNRTYHFKIQPITAVNNTNSNNNNKSFNRQKYDSRSMHRNTHEDKLAFNNNTRKLIKNNPIFNKTIIDQTISNNDHKDYKKPSRLPPAANYQSNTQSRYSHSRSHDHNHHQHRSTQKSFCGSQKQSSYNKAFGMNKKLVIQSQQQLNQLQAVIDKLWQIYQILTRIMQGVEEFPYIKQQQVQIYISEVTDEGLEEIGFILSRIKNKRLIKVVKMAKLLQNVSIVYLALELTKRKPIKQSHIVNFIGYCTSNIIFLIKILYLLHELNPISLLDEQGVKPTVSVFNQLSQLKQTNQSPLLTYSPHTKSILNIIKKFQLQSYKQQLTSLLDVVLRMQHNNQIINIVQVKLCSQSHKDVQQIITEFLKSSVRQDHLHSESYYSFAHYIFEFLAFHIAKQKLYNGPLPSVEVCPSPYLTLKYPHTVIIEPYSVLVLQKKSNILIRAYSDKFISQLSNFCNVIFWSDMMQDDINPILQLFEKKSNISRLYRYHCIYDQQTKSYRKPLDRIGCKVQNTIIIDSNMNNFSHHKSNGIEFPWQGEKNDKKLLQLYKILQPIFSKNYTLRKSLAQIRPQITQLLIKKKSIFNTKYLKKPPVHRFRSIDQQLAIHQKKQSFNQQQNSRHENYDNYQNRHNNMSLNNQDYHKEYRNASRPMIEDDHTDMSMQVVKHDIRDSLEEDVE